MKKYAMISLIISISLLCSCSKNSELSSDNESSAELFTETTIDNEVENTSIETIETSKTEDYTSEAGGNSTVSVLLLTISEDKYFVDNHEVSYNDLVDILVLLDDNSYVKIYDERSTLKAFNKVKEFLEENNISYELE